MASQRNVATSPIPTAGSAPRPDLISADWLAGVPVFAADGKSVGELAHVMLDMPRGIIAYAALSSARLFGTPDRLVAVPWRMLAFDATGRRCTLQLDPERLRRAPQRERGQWPQLADPAFAAEIEACYGPPAVPTT